VKTARILYPGNCATRLALCIGVAVQPEEGSESGSWGLLFGEDFGANGILGGSCREQGVKTVGCSRWQWRWSVKRSRSLEMMLSTSMGRRSTTYVWKGSPRSRVCSVHTYCLVATCFVSLFLVFRSWWIGRDFNLRGRACTNQGVNVLCVLSFGMCRWPWWVWCMTRMRGTSTRLSCWTIQRAELRSNAGEFSFFWLIRCTCALHALWRKLLIVYKEKSLEFRCTVLCERHLFRISVKELHSVWDGGWVNTRLQFEAKWKIPFRYLVEITEGAKWGGYAKWWVVEDWATYGWPK
jgi:hypothetical protein